MLLKTRYHIRAFAGALCYEHVHQFFNHGETHSAPRKKETIIITSSAFITDNFFNRKPD